MEILNAIVVTLSSISTVFLLQEKLLSLGNTKTLSFWEMQSLRGLIATTNAAQLATILTSITFPVLLLNATLALTKLFLIKKL
jgi:hypothetical protein